MTKIMANDQSWTVREVVFAIAGIAFTLFLHRAIPFFMIPTLGQAVWTTGFSQSFANGPLFNIYARDFGIPKPSAIAFGLAGAWPASWLIRLGLHPADAYAGMVAFWLVLAFVSAYRIARCMKAPRSMCLLGAVAWISMPVIWAHAGYSMVSLGIGLLAFYFLSALKLFLIESGRDKVPMSAIVLYLVAAIIAVFMDGYTFMMFATGASVLFAYAVITQPEKRTALLRIALPVHISSFALAYVLYSAYIGKLDFEPQPIDLFRGWGLDLSFIVIPTKGMLWLPDMLGMSLKRSDQLYFGDGSVWKTTFSLPVILAGLVAWWRVRKQVQTASGVLLVAAFGFYMALGPSLKINSTKPESLQLMQPGQQSALMPPELAVMPTGNAWISEYLPGFNVMRASYRWSALGMFALWFLVVIGMARSHQNGGALRQWILVVLIILNLPNMPKRWQGGVDALTMFHEIDRALVTELRQKIQQGETVALLPWGNDFIANYLAPRADFRTFNIGGDKNLAEAQKKWPSDMLTLGGKIDTGKVPAMLKMLIDGTADVLVVPYFHMLWSPHLWPCLEETKARLSEEQKENTLRIQGFYCPTERRVEIRPVIRALQESPYVDVVDSNLFATIKLRPGFAGESNRKALMAALLGNIHYPILLGSEFKESPFVLQEGWHALEEHHVWSQARAKITLPVPKDCATNQCKAILEFNVFGASQQRPVSVMFDSTGGGSGWSETIVSTSGSGNEVSVPLTSAMGSQEISVSIPDATSPRAFAGSPDGRILGIALQRIDLVSK